ncbi:MAG: type III-B CRISPR module-associated Cmr3 family protein [Thermofilaceae archaeon]
MSGVSVYQVRIKPLEPLMLRGPGEFDPSARGVSAAAVSQAFLAPSTVAGLLVSLLLRQPVEPVSDWMCYVDRMLELLNKLGIRWIRGPYLAQGSTPYVPIRAGGDLFFIDLHQLAYHFKRELANIERAGGDLFFIDLNQLAYHFKRELANIEKGDLEGFMSRLRQIQDRAEPRLQERVGIALTAREGLKAVREGFLYTASYVSVRCDYIAVEIGSDSGAAPGSLARLNGAAAAVGGEGRVARLEVLGVDGGVAELVAGSEFEGGYAVLLSPLVLRSPMRIERKGGRVSVKVGDKCFLELISGTVGLRGLGFSIAERSRKPVYPAILEGSIVKLCEGQRYTRDVGPYANVPGGALLELLGRIGYGSLAALE